MVDGSRKLSGVASTLVLAGYPRISMGHLFQGKFGSIVPIDTVKVVRMVRYRKDGRKV